MTDPDLVHSGLSQRVTVEGQEFHVEIYRLEHQTTWALEVVDAEDGASTVWDDEFETAQNAMDVVLKTIEEEGLGAFRESADVIEFPKR